MSLTTQHAVIEALVRVFTAAIEQPVYDGPNYDDSVESAAVWVGYDPTDENAQAVDSAQDWAEVGARAKNETGTITCTAGAWSGDSSTTARRELIAGMLSALEAAHRADVTLGGACLYSNFGDRVTLHQQLTENGNEVLALFTISFMSRI
jgi:hypothetical protein